MKSILSVAEAYAKMSEDSENLAATNAAQAQQKQEDQPEIPSWVPGNIPDEKKKEFAEAAQKAWESDNTQFDFDGRTYKITEKLHGNQHKLDVNNNGKIDADDLAALRSGEKEANEELVGNQHKLDVNKNGKIDGDDLAALRAGKKPTNEHHFENETETPGQTQYPGSDMKDTNGNGEIDGEDKAEMPDEEENDEGLEESVRLKKSQDMLKVAHGAMSRDEFKKKWAHLKKPKNKLAGPGGLYKNLVKEAEENPTDKLTIDVPAMIRALEKSREDFKSDEDIHNFVQNLLKKKDATIDTNALPKNEALDPKADAGTWISDFVHSTDPKFDGKSKEKRKEMALAAYYQARRDAGLKEEVMTEATATDLSKKAHALSAAASTAKDHKTAANAHYKAADALRRHTTANAGKTGKKADAAHDAALKHEALGDKHLEKAMSGKNPVQEQTVNEAWHDPVTDEHARNITANANKASDSGNHAEAAKAHKAAAAYYSKFAEHGKDSRLKNIAKTFHQMHSDMAAHHSDAAVQKESTQSNDMKLIKENVAGDHRAVDLTTAANQASALAHSTPSEAGALAHHDAATKAHQHAADHYRVYAHHAGDPELRRAAEIHHKFHTDMAQHHTLKGVSLSMNEKPADNVNRYASGHMEEGTSADAKGGPEVMDVATKKMKDDADKNVKAEEAPYTNKADGTEEVTPAEKPKANPSPMPTLTKEQALRSVASAYEAMQNEAVGIDDSALVEQMNQIDEATGLPKSPKNPHPEDHVKHHEFKAKHATAVANHYSSIANKSGRKSDHQRAAKAHHKASHLHGMASAAHADFLKGSSDKGEEAASNRSNAHYEKAAHHEDKAAGHSD